MFLFLSFFGTEFSYSHGKMIGGERENDDDTQGPSMLVDLVARFDSVKFEWSKVGNINQA